MAVAWNIFQPFLFGLIGAEVSITSLRPETVGKIIHKLLSFIHYPAFITNFENTSIKKPKTKQIMDDPPKKIKKPEAPMHKSTENCLSVAGLCVAILGIALVVRIIATFLMVSFAGFNFKEKVFVSLAWIPKATVQVNNPTSLSFQAKSIFFSKAP